MNMKKSFLLLCGCLAIASACCNQPVKTAGINYAYMDTTARPGDDFAKYATGHWADLNPSRLSTLCGEPWQKSATRMLRLSLD